MLGVPCAAGYDSELAVCGAGYQLWQRIGYSGAGGYRMYAELAIGYSYDTWCGTCTIIAVGSNYRACPTSAAFGVRRGLHVDPLCRIERL